MTDDLAVWSEAEAAARERYPQIAADWDAEYADPTLAPRVGLGGLRFALCSRCGSATVERSQETHLAWHRALSWREFFLLRLLAGLSISLDAHLADDDLIRQAGS